MQTCRIYGARGGWRNIVFIAHACSSNHFPMCPCSLCSNWLLGFQILQKISTFGEPLGVVITYLLHYRLLLYKRALCARFYMLKVMVVLCMVGIN